MTLQEVIQNLISAINNEDLTSVMRAAKDEVEGLSEEAQRLALNTIFKLMVSDWNISSDINQRVSNIDRIKREFLAVMAIPGVLGFVNSDVHDAMIAKVNHLDTMSLMDQAVQPVDNRFFPTFFRNLLTQENSEDRVADIEILMQLDFLQKLACFPMGQGELVLRTIFSAQGTAKADALIEALFVLNTQSTFTMPPLTRALTQEVANFDQPLMGAVCKLKEKLGYQNFVALCDSDTTGSFKAAALPLLTAKPEASIAEQAEIMVDQLMVSNVDLSTLLGKNFFKKISIKDQPDAQRAFLNKLQTYVHTINSWAREKDDIKFDTPRYNHIMTLFDLLNQLSADNQKNVETLLGQEGFVSLSVIIIKARIVTYAQKNAKLLKWFGNIAQKTIRSKNSQTVDKEEFWSTLLDFLLSQTQKTDGEVVLPYNGANELLHYVYISLYSSKGKEIKVTPEQLNAWIENHLLEGIDTFRTLSWVAPPVDLDVIFAGLPAWQKLRGGADVVTSSASAAASDADVYCRTDARSSMRMKADSLQQAQQQATVMRARTTEGDDAANDMAGASAASSSFGPSSSTLVGAGAKQAQTGDAAAKKGWALPSVFGGRK